MRALDGRFGG